MKNHICRNALKFTVSIELLFSSVLFIEAPPSLADSPMRLGVFFGSYGDVDAKGEIEELITSTISDRDMVPLPSLVRKLIAKSAWTFGQNKITEEYQAVGWTRYRSVSQQQADLVAAKLRDTGLWAQGYTGFTFTFPHVAEGLLKAQKDGVNRLVVFYQGAQHSRVTSHIVFRDVKKYLDEHPEWDVKVTAVTSFAKDDRFLNLLFQNIEDRRLKSFPDSAAEDICIFLPVHGNYQKWISQGDPSYQQMLYDIDAVRERFPRHSVYYGFQNHEEIPLLQWTQPRVNDSLDDLALNSCSKVIINGRISFTIDNLETLYDQAIAQKKYLEEIAIQHGQPKEIVVESMFNVEDSFSDFLKELSLDALNGRGNLLEISELSEIFPPNHSHPHE